MDIQWLGHSAFKVVAGKAHVLFDPFLNGNPLFSGDYEGIVRGTTHVLMTHAHNDHFGDTVDILKRTGATLVANYEICMYVASVYAEAKIWPMNIGGTATVGEIEATLVRAHHSSSYAAPTAASSMAAKRAASSCASASGRSITWATPRPSPTWR